MDLSLKLGVLFIGSYLLGAVPVGLLVSRARGIDIRKHGSGNIGATNVGRTLGRKWGVLVLVLDMLKGAATSIAATVLIDVIGQSVATSGRDLIWLGTGLCCVIGNTFPLYLRFKGGKGVATALGVILGIWPYLTLPAVTAALVWLIAVKIGRYVSLASILAAATLPVAFIAMSLPMGWSVVDHYPLLILTVALACLVMIRHRENIGRLRRGTENRVGDDDSLSHPSS